MFGGIKIGRIAGIPFLVNPTWFIIFALVAYTISTQELPYLLSGEASWVYWILGAAITLLYFASLVAHEMGHSVASRYYGIPVISITLYIFGGVAQIAKEAQRAREEFVIAIAGPVVSLALGGVFYGLGNLVATTLPIVGVSFQLLGFLNLAVLVFNLVPGFPLDGGRMLRALLWGITRDYLRATRVASRTGQGFGILMVVVGVYLAVVRLDTGAIWTVFVGLFLISIARSSGAQASMQHTLKRYTVSDILVSLITVSANLTVDELYSGYVRTTGRPVYLVEMYGVPAGLVWTNIIEQVPHEHWASTPLATVMQSIGLVGRIGRDASLDEALLKMNEGRSNLLLVYDGDRPSGVLTRDRILRVLLAKTDAR